MFNFFKKNKISIDSLIMPNLGWKKVATSTSQISWINEAQTGSISLYFFDKKPDLSTVKELDELISNYRKSIVSANGGLIDVSLLKINDVQSVKTIFKIKTQDMGMVYSASITIPFKNYSFVIKIQTVEEGISGIRDSVIADRLLQTEEISVSEIGFKNWFADPYDATFNEGILMNKSEREIYDTEFPFHPLSIARTLLEKICREVIFKKEIESLEAFDK